MDIAIQGECNLIIIIIITVIICHHHCCHYQFYLNIIVTFKSHHDHHRCYSRHYRYQLVIYHRPHSKHTTLLTSSSTMLSYSSLRTLVVLVFLVLVLRRECCNINLLVYSPLSTIVSSLASLFDFTIGLSLTLS